MKILLTVLGLVILGVMGFLFMRSDTDTAQASKELPNNAVIVDTRTSQEFALSHAEGAVNLPLQDIQMGTLPDADKTTPLYVYCQSGNRSAQAASVLERAGYTNIVDMGGINEINKYGLSITES